ncbi:hypothetical protein BJV74DRAFT_834975 [Russula compacta]|nr:hypothetical protein BJV74DRAFT_834975 [Russula compacta]
MFQPSSSAQSLDSASSDVYASAGGIRVRDVDGVFRIYANVIYGPEDPSFEELRLRYYLDTFRAWVPKTHQRTNSSERVDAKTSSSIAHDLDIGRFGSSSHAPGTADAESTTSTCSLCAARLATGGGVHGGDNDSEAPLPDNVVKSDDIDVRRLQKTVEGPSQVPVLAPNQPKAGDIHAEPRGSSSGIDGLSTVLAGMELLNDSCSGTGTLAPLRPSTESYSREENLLRSRLSPSFHWPTAFPENYRAGPDNAFDCTATRNDMSLFSSKDRSPIAAILGPISKFIASSDVGQFLNQAKIHSGLCSTQIFDLFWVLNNLFNIHGGILIHCLRKSLTTMNDISRSLGLDEWSHNLEFIQKLDGAYRKMLHPHIHTDGDYGTGGSSAWKSYCLELAVIFSESFPNWQSARYFRDLSESYCGYFNPVITASYIEDLVMLWTEVHPALLEVTRWLEPFIDYGPDYIRDTPFFDATIVLGCRTRELFSRGGVSQPELPQRADSLLHLLRGHRSESLAEMQVEMASVMSTVSRDFDPTDDDGDNTPTESGPQSVEEFALVERATEVTGWEVTEFGSVRMRNALALHEVRVMKSYRPRLLRAGTAAAKIRGKIFHILSQTERRGRDVSPSEKNVFWDRID